MFAIASAFAAVAVTLTLVAGLELVAAAFIVAVTALAFEALAARTAVLLRRRRRRAVGRGCCGLRRRIGAVLAEMEILVPTPSAVLLALVALAAGFAGGRLGAVLLRLMAVTMTLGARPAFLRTAAGPPDFDQFGLSGRSRRGFDRRGLSGTSRFAGGDGLCDCFSGRFSRCLDGLI